MKPTALARELLAKQIEDQGPAWKNCADSVRSGFTNLWLAPALAAIDHALDTGRAEED